MKKNDFKQLMDCIIDHRDDMSVVFTGNEFVRLYTDDNLFSATFICHLIDIARDHFIGVSADCYGRPFLLFTE